MSETVITMCFFSLFIRQFNILAILFINNEGESVKTIIEEVFYVKRLAVNMAFLFYTLWTHFFLICCILQLQTFNLDFKFCMILCLENPSYPHSLV